MKRPHSIDISGTRFAELLASRRRALGLSKIDLAEKAALSGKVVHQIETGSRVKFLEKTLLLLADAVETPLEDLLGPLGSDVDTTTPASAARQPVAPEGYTARPAPHRRQRSRRLTALVAASVLLIAVTVIVAALRAPRTPQIEVLGTTIYARSAGTGKLIWSRSFESTVYVAEPSPWGDGSVIATLDLRGTDGGRVLLLDGRTGKTIWDRSPDPDLAEAAFGEGALDGVPAFSPIRCRYLDLDGDGTLELAVTFEHPRSYPGCVMALNRHGKVLGQYFNRGYIHDMAVIDLDGDGKQSLVCVGANSGMRFHGGTVFILDQDHWSGAAVDPIAGGNPDVGDGAFRRILIPPFDPKTMGFLHRFRVEATCVLTTRSSDGSLAIMASVGTHGFGFHLMLDPDLNPLELKRTDNIAVVVARWPVDDPATYGPNCPEWRAQWMQGIIRVDRYALGGGPGMPDYKVDGVAASDPEGRTE